MSKSLISVLLPVYNGEDYVSEAVKSILNQSYKNFELIIVDDGSEDDTLGILRNFSDSRVKIHPKQHSGIADSLNFGLSQCSGQLIARMDADDISFPDRLTALYNYIGSHPETGAVASLVEYAREEDLADGYSNYVDWINSLTDRRLLKINRFVESPFAHPSMLFRKELIVKYGGYTPGDIPEDYELWLRWFHEGVVIDKVAETLLRWNDRSKRISRVHDHYSEGSFFRVKAAYFRKWYDQDGAGRDLVIWGRGRVMRRRLAYFENEGLKISHYIDIVTRQSDRYIHFEEVSKYRNAIVLCFVSDRKGKEKISSFLNQKDFIEGADFFHVV